MTLSRTGSLCLFATVLLVLLISSAKSFSQQGQSIEQTLPPPSNHYPLGPDSLAHPSVPPGKIFKFTLANSKIFPGTSREITVYIPAEYRATKPACIYIGLDDLLFNAPTVFDNLIAQHAMPVMIAIGVPPGVVASGKPPNDPRFDRSFEFDSMSDRLARFLLEEVIPAVEQYRTPSSIGRPPGSAGEAVGV
jgi:enterochelin esterase-like enzyme